MSAFLEGIEEAQASIDQRNTVEAAIMKLANPQSEEERAVVAGFAHQLQAYANALDHEQKKIMRLTALLAAYDVPWEIVRAVLEDNPLPAGPSEEK